MYLAIDIGGTKTLVASLTDEGVIIERLRFETPKDYSEFIANLTRVVDQLTTKEFVACGVGVPGRLDREKGIGIAMGNLPWHNVPIMQDVQNIAHCPVVIHNDAKLAGLSEAMLLKNEYSRVLFATISTGIGVSLITNQTIDPALADAEAGKAPILRGDKMVPWEDFASGRAIVNRFGKRAADIHDEATWKIIAHDIAIGLIDLIATVQPEVVVLGGSVGSHLDRFKSFLEEELKKFETPLIPIPPIRPAQRPDDAVLYGCYDLAKSVYGKAD
ncbi:ROK family protein [Candidatus Saccharibacteria bacterium]|jgi:Transcriptional regulator/sugar kinase|nr:ROK family protein [Candidatus Saccharibacteria bacterium]